MSLFGDSSKCCLNLLELIRQAHLPVFPRSNDARLASPLTLQRVVHLEDGSIKIVDNPGAPSVFLTSIDSSSSLRGALDFMQKSGRSVRFAECSDPLICGQAAELGAAYASGKYGMRVLPKVQLDASMSRSELKQTMQDYIDLHPDLDWLYIHQGALPLEPLLEALQGHDTRLMLGLWAMDESVAALPLARAKVFGLVAARPFGDMVGSRAMPDLVQNFYTSERAADFADLHYVMGYASVALWSIAVQRVIEQGKEPDCGNLLDALNALHDVQTGGLLPTVTLSAEDHRPLMRANIYKIDREGSFTYVDDFTVDRQKDWLGW